MTVPRPGRRPMDERHTQEQKHDADCDGVHCARAHLHQSYAERRKYEDSDEGKTRRIRRKLAVDAATNTPNAERPFGPEIHLSAHAKQDAYVRRQLERLIPCPVCHTIVSLSDTIKDAEGEWNCTCHVCDTKLTYALYVFGPPRFVVRAGTAVHYDPKETK